MTHTIPLPGCTPEPLMNYLKALGVLRLLTASAAGDPNARGYWTEGAFALQTHISEEALERFFLEDYVPTPVVVPWSGSDFFAVEQLNESPVFAETPTGSTVIAAFSATKHDRFAPYRSAIDACLSSLKEAGIEKKEQMKGEAKSRFLGLLRGKADASVIDWIDAAAVIESAKPIFSSMLGSGGGSDGNTHFSDNFMQNIWDVFSEFDSQRKARKGQSGEPPTRATSTSLLQQSLFGIPTPHLIPKRTSSLFDGGAVGGPNAGQGFERESLGNPWNFILALEGAISFAGALCKRTGVRSFGQPAFPFQVQASPNTAASVVEKEQAGKELWLPMWSRPATGAEIQQILTEGRMQTGSRPAASGVDAARAVAALGIDRGLSGFQRFAVLRGRVGGDNYNTAASLGFHSVRHQRDVDLLRVLDWWLSVFRSRCFEKEGEEDRKKGNVRFTAALRRVERAIFDYCRYGGPHFFQGILLALGAAEQAIAGAPGFREKAKGLRPLANLSAGWIASANDGTREFELALALASIRDRSCAIGSLRTNLEPVVLDPPRAAWAEKDRAVVWTASDLFANLAAVLNRRVMDGMRASSNSRPLYSKHCASRDAVAAFVAGDLDESRLSELIWGLLLCDTEAAARPESSSGDDVVSRPLPRAFALLKLLFLDLAEDRPSGNPLAPELYEKLHALRPEPAILALVRTGDVPGACRIAARRLRAVGLQPRPHARAGAHSRDEDWTNADCDPATSRRLAAGLLIPIDPGTVAELCEMICRPLQPNNANHKTYAH